ncbi:MAG: arginine--tRNA ligase [Promethearchaeota archaeon]
MKFINKKIIAELLKKYIKNFTIDEIESLIEIPPSNKNFNFAFPCYRLAQHEKKAPDIIAKDLELKITLPDYIDKIEADGPYINIRIKPSVILNNIFELKEEYGKISTEEKNRPLRIVIEYPSPNTNKPLHLGHVRNMLIGSTSSNLLKYLGHKVFQVNLNNDRGIHICKSMLAYKKWGNDQVPHIKSDHFVGQFYVKYSEEEEKDESLSDEIKTMLMLWEQKDPEIRQLWEKMNNWALNGFKETYKKFNISFDKEYNESEFYWKGKEKILEGLEKGIFEKREDGAIIASLKERKGLQDKILLRSDGTSIYITQDIFLAYLKKQDFNYDRSIYVVGNEQDLYFKQLFAILDLLGFKEDKFHFSYGMISLPEGKMKSREGKVVDADDIVEEMHQLAYEEINNRYPTLSEEEKNYRADIIGKSAIRFFILKFNPKSDFIFNPNDSISFEGETGPYIQYCYARIESIILKSDQKIDLDVNFDLLNHEKELDLIKYLYIFPELVEQVANNYNIHLIPQYLLNLCQSFNSFYDTCRVISDDKNIEKVRILLIKCVQIVIKIGLKLLGIETLEKM